MSVKKRRPENNERMTKKRMTSMMMENWGWGECWSKSITAMALRLRPKVTSIGSPFPQLGSSATACSFSQACSVPKLGFHHLRFQRKRNPSPTTFFVRASRNESKGVTLGFRAPQFEVLTFPTPPSFVFSVLWNMEWSNYYMLYFLLFFFLMDWKCISFRSPLLGRFGH